MDVEQAIAFSRAMEEKLKKAAHVDAKKKA